MTLLRQSNRLLHRPLSAASLALALLLANACEPTNSTIGSVELLSGGPCERAGEIRSLGDGCNDCTCGADLRWECTALACDAGTSGTSGAGGSSGEGGSSGSSASGGTSGSGAGGASAGSAGSTGSGGSAGTGGCGQQCSAPEVGWRRDGGLAPEIRSSTLTSCTVYRHIRTPSAVLLPQRECSVTLDCIEPTVQEALSRADVAASFEAGTLFGADMRPVDGQVLIVTYRGKDLTVGRQCTSQDPPNCIPIPDGVEILVAALQDLDQRMLMRQECTSVFGP